MYDAYHNIIRRILCSSRKQGLILCVMPYFRVYTIRSYYCYYHYAGCDLKQKRKKEKENKRTSTVRDDCRSQRFFTLVREKANSFALRGHNNI